MPAAIPAGLFESILEGTNLVVYLKDVDGRYLYVNREYEAVSTVKREFIIGKRDEDLFAPEVAALFRAQDAEIIAAREHKTFEETIPLPAGVRSFITEKFPLIDEKGKVYAVGGFCTEITAKELELRKAREQTQITLDAMQDIFYVISRSGRFLSWNRSMTRVTGYTDGEIAKMGPLDFFAGGDIAKIALAIAKVWSEGKATADAHVKAKDGRLIHFEFAGSAVKGSDGQIIGLSGIGRDLSERDRAEDSLRRLRDQLQQAQKMELIGRMAGGVAHDFNNLMGVISNYAGLLKAAIPDGEGGRADADEILSAAARAAVLTRQLLALGRKQPSNPQVIDAAAAAEAVVRMYARAIGPDVVFKARCLSSERCDVLFDPGQFDQLLLNLLINAQQAISGSGSVTVETAIVEMPDDFFSDKPALKRGPLVIVRVQDTGTGMSEEVRSRLFEPFFTTKEHGTGLGLASVYGILKQHGGEIAVESAPGKGSTFSLYLPRARPA